MPLTELTCENLRKKKEANHSHCRIPSLEEKLDSCAVAAIGAKIILL